MPDLNVNDIRCELRARGVADVLKNRPEIQRHLQEIFKGVQRVPSLLLLNPQQNLADLNMEEYTIMDCEPMHDLKGHLLNLFSELPSILPNSVHAMYWSH